MTINNLETFKSRISEGKLCLGMVVSLSDPTISELAGDAGWDFTWIDAEHAPLNTERVLGHVMALRGTSCAPFVRVPGNDPVIIKPYLDLAPAAIIIPMVNGAEEAAAAVAACRYPPKGVRGCGPRRGTGFGSTALPDYLRQSEEEPLVIIQIEHVKAVDELDEILAVEGLGSICVGPSDLSASMGKLRVGEDDSEVREVIDHVCAKTKEAGLMLGSFASPNPDKIRQWMKRGANWLGVGGDWGFVATGSRRTIENVNAALQ